MRNPRKIKVTKQMLEQHSLSSAPPPPESIFWEMWYENLQIAQNALNSPFVQDIKSGKLNPVTYGAFCVSDAYYCFNGADDYTNAAKAADGKGEHKIAAFLKKKAESYKSYNEQFSQIWHVKDASGVIPTTVTKAYAAFESEVAKKDDPILTLVAMLPCDFLWAWLGQQLDPYATDDNPYKDWIKGNQGFSGSYAIGNFLEQYLPENKKSKASEIYSKAINFEWKNFLAGT